MSQVRTFIVLSGLVLGTGSLFSPFAQAQSETIPTLSSLEKQTNLALEAEKQGRWEEALQIWFRIVGQDKANPEFRDHLRICLRHVLQSRRHRDPNFQAKILELPHPEALNLYAEVVKKLQTNYVDRDKVSPARLLRQGLEELRSALQDKAFCRLYLKDTDEVLIDEFRNRLQEAWLDRPVENEKQAKEIVGEIARAARRILGMQKVNALVLEFICGACNSLDEYTTFMAPGPKSVEVSSSTETSVHGSAFLKDGLAYLRISHFQSTTVAEMDNALTTLRMTPGAGNLRALILDLRGNVGGSFASAVQVAERFLPTGVIVSSQGQVNEFNKVYSSNSGMNALDMPLIVLVDADTASAAEVLAGALRDHQRATLVGTATFGKGSVQCLIRLTMSDSEESRGKSKAGSMRVTLARLFSPSGQALQGVGITPNILEPIKERQLDAAIEHANRFLSTMMMR